MWPTLTGRKSVANGIAFASWALLVVAAIVGSWIYRHPEVQPWLVSVVPWMLGVLLLLKLGAAAAAGFWLHKLGLVEFSNRGEVPGWLVCRRRRASSGNKPSGSTQLAYGGVGCFVSAAGAHCSCPTSAAPESPPLKPLDRFACQP